MELPGDEVHFWYAFLDRPDAPIEDYRCILSEEETGRAERFHFERDRTSYIVSHGVLRQLLGEYTRLPPEELVFESGARGKPFLHADCNDGTLQFNLSHTYGLAAFAVTRNRNVGVDVEWMERPVDDRDAIAERFFAARETAAYRSLPAEDKVEAFYNCWTRKEAFLKATGEGLSHPLDSFRVSLQPGDVPTLIEVRGDRADRWSMASVDPVAGYKAAVVAEGTWNLVNNGAFPLAN